MNTIRLFPQIITMFMLDIIQLLKILLLMGYLLCDLVCSSQAGRYKALLFIKTQTFFTTLPLGAIVGDHFRKKPITKFYPRFGLWIKSRLPLLRRHKPYRLPRINRSIRVEKL